MKLRAIVALLKRKQINIWKRKSTLTNQKILLVNLYFGSSD